MVPTITIYPFTVMSTVARTDGRNMDRGMGEGIGGTEKSLDL
jgi:hypothetical protein